MARVFKGKSIPVVDQSPDVHEIRFRREAQQHDPETGEPLPRRWLAEAVLEDSGGNVGVFSVEAATIGTASQRTGLLGYRDALVAAALAQLTEEMP